MPQTFRDLKQNIGNTLQLQVSPSNKDERFYVKLIGVLKNKSVLITTPRVDGGSLKIEDKQKFIVRMMSGSSALVFTSTTIYSSNHPYAHLHLTYPDKLESITIRKAERTSCNLIVTVHKTKESTDEGLSASIQDISNAGAQLFSNEILGNVGDNILIHAKFSVAAMEQYLTIPAIIRRSVELKDNQTQREYGVEFDTIKNEDKLVLTAYVYEQMMLQG